MLAYVLSLGKNNLLKKRCEISLFVKRTALRKEKSQITCYLKHLCVTTEARVKLHQNIVWSVLYHYITILKIIESVTLIKIIS